MRTTFDRIRHAISFEAIALAIITPIGAWVFGLPLREMGLVTLISATIATFWNFGYNILFDHALLRLRRTTQKTVALRVVHAVLFEVGLLALLVPFIALYLDVTLRVAFVMDVAFSAFYLVYAFAFNWAYDLMFPVAPTVHSK
jgi:uncharacterized membrane protein